MRYSRSNYTNQNGITLIDRHTGKKSKSMRDLQDPDYLVPVIKFDKNGKLIFSNLASLPLLSYWGARDLKEIPILFLEKYPQIFDKKSETISLPYKGDQYSFKTEVSADDFFVTLVMIEEMKTEELGVQPSIEFPQLSIQIKPDGMIVTAFSNSDKFNGLPVSEMPGTSFYHIADGDMIKSLINRRSDRVMEHAGADFKMKTGSKKTVNVYADVFLQREVPNGIAENIYLNIKTNDFKLDDKFAKAHATGAFAEFRRVFNLLGLSHSVEDAFNSLTGFISLCLDVREIGIFNFKTGSWIYPKDSESNFLLELNNLDLPKQDLVNQKPLIYSGPEGVDYFVIPCETAFKLSHCLCFKIPNKFNPDDAVIDLISLLFSHTILACSNNILGQDDSIEKEDLYDILNNLQDTFYRTNSDGNLVMVNNSILDLLGYLPEEVRGANIKDFYSRKEEHSDIRSLIKENGHLKNKGISMRHKDGHEVQVILNARGVYDSNGKYLGSEGIMHDSTELISKESALRALFESGFRSIISVDRTFCIKAINDRARIQIKSNLDIDVEIGLSVRNLFRAVEFYDLNTSIVKAFKGKNGNLQQVFKLPGKEHVWYKIDLLPIINPNNSIDEILIVAENITELKQKQLEISRLYKALDENPNEVYIFDASCFNVLYANNGGLLNLGYSRDALKRQFAWDFMVKFTDTSFAQLVQKLKSGESSELTFETRHQRKSGKTYPVEVHLTLNETDGNKYLVCIAIDITSRKQQEIILRKKNKELEKVNFELDRFVYSASHDLKAPLRSVLGLISIARKEITEDQNQIYFDMMNKSIHKLDGFISDMIDYSRNTRLELDHQHVDLKILLDETLDNLRYHEGTGLVGVSVDLNMKCDFISDSKRMGIILNNLCSNSVKYRDETKENPYLHVKIDCDASRALIIVQDNGIGICKEDHKKIFGMFYRSSVKSYGSGLGLYIVNEIVSKLNGTIQVKSEPGQGTEFIIQIPNKLKNNTFVNEFEISH